MDDNVQIEICSKIDVALRDVFCCSNVVCTFNLKKRLERKGQKSHGLVSFDVHYVVRAEVHYILIITKTG